MPIPLVPIAMIGITLVGGSAYMKHVRNVALKKGYEKASAEFEKKYERQYEDFMSKKKTWEKHRKEYSEVIEAYKKFVQELKRELDDIKTNGFESESRCAIVSTGMMLPTYCLGLQNAIEKYTIQLNNLEALKDK